MPKNSQKFSFFREGDDLEQVKPKHVFHTFNVNAFTCQIYFLSELQNHLWGLHLTVCICAVRMGGSLWQPSPSAHHPFQRKENDCKDSFESWLLITQTYY